MRGDVPDKVVAVSFDDGYRTVIDHALPVLSELGLPATIFVPTDYVGRERPMFWPGIEQSVAGQHEHELRCIDCWPRVGVYPIDCPWRFRLKPSPAVGGVRVNRLGQLVEEARFAIPPGLSPFVEEASGGLGRGRGALNHAREGPCAAPEQAAGRTRPPGHR